MYKRSSENVVVFLIFYVDDIHIKNDGGTLSSVKIWLSTQFDMKDLGKASHILLGKKTASHALLYLCMAQSFDTLIKLSFSS